MTTAPPLQAGAQAPALLLLPTQLVFNIGFYAVVPFLALVMTRDLGLGAAAVGLVLGARTFSQQGMFLFGGVIADRWGPRRTIFTGCMIRAAGFLGLASADHLLLFLGGAVLTGMGGALFSPAIESLLGSLDQARTSNGKRGPTLFAWLVLFGEVGAVMGPLVGIGLLALGFPVVAASAAGLFLVAGLVLWILLPNGNSAAVPPPADAGPRARGGAWACLRDRRFVGFAALFSVNLLAHNQLYFALPLELERAGSGSGQLALLFTLASILTIALQLPVAALSARVGAAVALRAGFGCIGLGCAAGALSGTALQAVLELPAAAGAVFFVVLLTFGHMLVAPAGMQQVPAFAGCRPLGAYFGLLATCGGTAVLLGNTLTGVLRESAGSASAWALLVALAAIAAVFTPRFLPVSR